MKDFDVLLKVLQEVLFDQIEFTHDFIWDIIFLVAGVIAGYSWILVQLL